MDVRCGSASPFTVHGSFRAIGAGPALLEVAFGDGQHVNYPIPTESSFSFTHSVGKSTALNSSKVIVSTASGKTAGWLSATRDGGVSAVACRRNTTTLVPANEFSIANVSITEGDTGTKEAVLAITRSGPTTNAVSVDDHTDDRDGTATGGAASSPTDDYVDKGSTKVDFLAGDSTGTAKSSSTVTWSTSRTRRSRSS